MWLSICTLARECAQTHTSSQVLQPLLRSLELNVTPLLPWPYFLGLATVTATLISCDFLLSVLHSLNPLVP